jgi:alkylation response protein AidB-like acyl-CoA dehydrogenase
VIGSFQAIKHILADTFVRQEVARAAAYAAGATLDQPEVGDPSRAVSSAKVVAGDAALANSLAGIQVHGGMGYTWEIPCH